jgi:hypothetical protein
MGVAAVGQNLHRRPGVDRKESDAPGDVLQVEENRFQIRLFDVLVDAACDLGRLGWSVFRKGRIVGELFEVPLAEIVQRLLQIAFARAVVRQRFEAGLVEDLLDQATP